MSREVQGLKLENEVLRSFCRRHLSEHVDYDEHETKRSRHRRRVVPQKLTAESKCEIAVLELEHVHQNLCVKTRDSEKLAGTLQAVLEETDMRTAELKKDAYEFKRDIVIGAENMRTGKAISEKVTRYMEDTLRQRDNLIEKLRLKNVSLKSQLLKVEAQLKHKEEMGDVLHYIDFHQLQIENKQYQGQIEDLNEELLRLKMMTGSSMQRLGIVKLRLSGIAVESQQIDGELLLRREHLDKVNGETKTVYAEMAVENRSCIHLHEKRAIHAPMTLDYVKQKAILHDLLRTRKNWMTKVEIAQTESRQRIT